jgi:hypothetical protein
MDQEIRAEHGHRTLIGPFPGSKGSISFPFLRDPEPGLDGCRGRPNL